MKNSIDFVNRLFALNPRYAQQNPLVQAQFTRHVAHDPHYVAHEFFNLHWDLMHFDEIAARLSEAKVQFAVSATASQNVDSINFTSAQREELSKIRDVNFNDIKPEVPTLFRVGMNGPLACCVFLLFSVQYLI